MYTAILSWAIVYFKKETSLVLNITDWNVDQPVADNRNLVFLNNLRLRGKFYHLERLKKSKQLYGHSAV